MRHGDNKRRRDPSTPRLSATPGMNRRGAPLRMTGVGCLDEESRTVKAQTDWEFMASRTREGDFIASLLRLVKEVEVDRVAIRGGATARSLQRNFRRKL